MAFVLVPGQASELRVAPLLLEAALALGTPSRVVTDRGYSSAAWRSLIQSVGAEPTVLSQPTHPLVFYNHAAYRRRHRIENLWARLKDGGHSPPATTKPPQASSVSSTSPPPSTGCLTNPSITVA
jgi:hypothetical protein